MKDIDDGVYGVSSWGVRGPTFLQELCVSPPEAHPLGFVGDLSARFWFFTVWVANPGRPFVHIPLGLFGHHSSLCNEEGPVSR